MTSHFFLLSDTLTTERLSWLEESLKFYFIQIYPESLMYQATAKSPVFTFLLTGDALTASKILKHRRSGCHPLPQCCRDHL